MGRLDSRGTVRSSLWQKIRRRDIFYPYWDYAIAFALDLINWIEKDEILESELSERIDQINYQMNYYTQEFKALF